MFANALAAAMATASGVVVNGMRQTRTNTRFRHTKARASAHAAVHLEGL